MLTANTPKALHSPAQGIPASPGYLGIPVLLLDPTLKGLNGEGDAARSSAIRIVAGCLLACFAWIGPARAQEEAPAAGQVRKTAVEKGDAAKVSDDAKKPPEEKRLDPRAMIRKLQARTDISADKTPLKEVLAQLSKRHDVVIKLDEVALKKAKVAPDVPVTATIKNLTLTAALGQLLKELKLRHVARDGVIVVTADVEVKDFEEAAKAHAERKEEEARDRAQRAAEVAVRGQAGVAMVDPVQAAADFDAQEKQFNRLFKAAREIELNFIRKVCDPTEEQIQGLEEILEKYRTDIVNKYSEAQKLAAKRGRQVAANPFPPDPHKKVRESLARTIKTNLTAEQVARFEQEVEKRGADRRQAAIRTLVARLDQDLSLSTDQRKKLTESLAGNWNKSWSELFETYLQQPGSQFLPNIAERLITPHLSTQQKKIWRASKDNNNNNQVNQGMIFLQGNVNFMGGPQGLAGDVLGGDDDDAAAEVVRPAPAAAARINVKVRNRKVAKEAADEERKE